MATVTEVVRGNAWLSRLWSTTPRWVWITAGVAGIALVAAGIALSEGNGGSAAAQDSTYAQHPEDVKVASCTKSGGYPVAALRVTNSSAAQATYAVQMTFEAPNGQAIYDTQTLIVPELPSHQTSAVQQVRGSIAVGAQSVSCVVTRAARYGT